MTLAIRSLRLAHCKRGPSRCATCREWDEERPCLLDLDPADRGLIQRRVLEVEVAGERRWVEFDVVEVFADRDQALRYARDHGIDDVELP